MWPKHKVVRVRPSRSTKNAETTVSTAIAVVSHPRAVAGRNAPSGETWFRIASTAPTRTIALLSYALNLSINVAGPTVLRTCTWGAVTRLCTAVFGGTAMRLFVTNFGVTIFLFFR